MASETSSNEPGKIKAATPAYRSIVEAFLYASLKSAVTRDRLSKISGVSNRILSHVFVKRNEMGPIGFLKQRHRDATYRTLLGTEQDATIET